MKKRILTLTLVLSLLLGMALPCFGVSGTIIPPSYPGDGSIPFTVTSLSGVVTPNADMKDILITYEADTPADVLRFALTGAGSLELFAAPGHRQPVALSPTKGVAVALEQKETVYYLRHTFGEAISEYTLTLLSPRSPMDYRDIAAVSDWALCYLNYLNEGGYGFIRGDEYSNANPLANMTRYEIAMIACRFLATDPTNFTVGKTKYDDKLVNWAKQAVGALTELGVISGHSEGGKLYYRGESNVTREQVAKIMVNMLLMRDGETKTAEQLYKESKRAYDKQLARFADESSISKWAHPYMALAVCHFGFLNGSSENGKLYANPGHFITRQEMTAIIARETGYSITPLLTELLSDAIPLVQAINKQPKYLRSTLKESYAAAKAALEKGSVKKKENAYAALFRVVDVIVSPKIIYLSPSNQMTNPYTGVATNEGVQMQKVAKQLKPMLEEMGFIVYIADVKTPLDKRALEAKKLGANLYISIHSNATAGGNNGHWQGSIVFHSNNPGSRELAQLTSKHLSKLTPTKDDGIRNDSLSARPYKEIHLPEMANILAEVEFHDYKPYAEWICANTKKIAKAFADAVAEFYVN